MKSNYKPIGDYIQRVEHRNRDLKVTRLLGLSMTKEFRETTSNIVGTDMSVYRVMSKYQFACDFMSPIRVNKLPVVLKLDDEPNLVSPAYPVFEIIDRNNLYPEYLMMWFRRSEFDRYATFKCDAAIRGGYEWNELCETLIPIPSITKQKEIVKEYNVIQNRITLNQQLIQKLEETAQAIYKQWFVDFEFPDENGKPYKSNGGEMVFNQELEREIPKGWESVNLSSMVNIKDGTHDSPNPIEIGFQLVTSTHLNLYDISLKETYNISEADYIQTNKRSKVEKCDILFSMIGTVGLVNYVLYDQINFAIKNVGLFKTSEKKEIAEYILFYLKSDYIKSYLVSNPNGSTQNYVTLSFLREMPIILPLEETLNKFKKTSKKIIETTHLTVKENNLLEEMKNLLLSKLATIEN